MAKESPFVEFAQSIAKKLLKPPMDVGLGVPLLYEIKVDNNLKVMDEKKLRKPTRGESAFQTDMCIFEVKAPEISIPRVVIEFKTRVSTHDILTYSAKASMHKQIYPYLRYGILASNEKFVPGRAFTHNKSLDFIASVDGLDDAELEAFLKSLLKAEIASSKLLESIAFGNVKTRLFRTDVRVA